MSQLTSSLHDFSEYLFNTLTAASVDLGLQAVYYGDQNKLPVTPVACVEPEQKVRTLSDAQRGTTVDFTVSIYIYHGAIDSVQENRRNADRMADKVEEVLHRDLTCGGLVIHSYAESIESGYSQKAGSIQRTSRIVFTGRSKHRLPAAPWNQGA